MSLALVENLADATGRLRIAMQQSDLSDIEKAMARFRQSMEALQAVGAWRADPVLKDRVKTVIDELESSRSLACMLGDLAGQMHLAYANRTPDAPQAVYQRPR